MATATATRTADQARDSIHRALPGPKGDEWSTARAVAAVVDMGYSTVTEHLRAMVETGTVATTKQGRSSVFRRNGPAPKLRKTDTVTPRAGRAARLAAATARTGVAYTPNGQVANPLAEQIVGELTKPLTVCGRSMRTGVTVELWGVPQDSKPCKKCYPAYGSPPAAAYDKGSMYTVWMSANRKGLDFHEPSSLPAAGPAPVIPVTAPESVAAATEPPAVPQPPAAARTPAGAAVGDAVAFLESVRPVSAAPAAPEQKAPRAPKADRQQPHAVFGRGELQAAILDHLRAHDDDWFTPTEMARAVNSGAGAAAYGLDRLVLKGEAVKADGSPQRYRAG
jgi:hypothetical protein